MVIAADIEAELAQLEDAAERRAFLESLGLGEPGLDRVIRAGYDLLGLITFFSTGPKETRAWTVPRGATAYEAAGEIHSDFQRGFIRAETVSSEVFLEAGGEQAAREAGKMRSEGRDYPVRDGDIMLFRFNVQFHLGLSVSVESPGVLGLACDPAGMGEWICIFVDGENRRRRPRSSAGADWLARPEGAAKGDRRRRCRRFSASTIISGADTDKFAGHGYASRSRRRSSTGSRFARGVELLATTRTD